MTRLTERDHELVTEAVTKAERATSGEIVVVAAARSTPITTSPSIALLAMLIVPAALALVPKS